MRNFLTIDVEEYFMASAFEDVAPESSWNKFPSRIDESTRKILDLLERFGTKATFFVVGYVARRSPGLVREIRDRGHEIGCHSNSHRLVYGMSREEFRQDTRDAKNLLEDLAGKRVVGYRAPSYSITGRSVWALDILIEEGFEYDSSIFPIRHDRYGFPGFPRFPVVVLRAGAGRITEFPLSTIRLLGMNLPVAGGGYFRIYPYKVSEWAVRRLNDGDRQRAVVYIHPWELDPDQPKMHGRAMSRFRHYTNLARTEGRLKAYLERFEFGPLGETAALPYPEVTL